MNSAKDNDFVAKFKAFAEMEKAEKAKARRVIVFFAGNDMGDFLRQNAAAAALTRPLQAFVAAVFKDSHPYRDFIYECNPYVHTAIRANANAAMTIPIDWFDIGVFAPVKCKAPEWEKYRLSEPDVVLLPGMLRCDLSRLLGLAETPPLLRIPPEQEDHLQKTLAERGIDENNWHACLHVTGSLESHLPLISHIVERQGGRVILIGTPAAEKTLEMNGVVHLSQGGHSLPEHAAAIALARYFMGGAAASVTLASLFRTPCAATNALHYSGMMWNKGDVVLARRIADPSGKRLTASEAFEKGLLDAPLPAGFAHHDNSPEELIAVSNHLHGLTAGCSDWRTPPEKIAAKEADGVTFPFPMRDKPLLTFWR